MGVSGLGRRGLVIATVEMAGVAGLLGGLALATWYAVTNGQVGSGAVAEPGVGSTIELRSSGYSKTARVAVVEFTDLQCPFCARFEATVRPGVLERYASAGALAWETRHFPLDEIHPNAVAAAVVAECAAEQARGEQVMVAIFSRQALLPSEGPLALAVDPVPDSDRLKRCVSEGEAQERVDSDRRVGVELQVRSTPTFLIGGVANGVVKIEKAIVGARPAGEFYRLLDGLLAKGR